MNVMFRLARMFPWCEPMEAKVEVKPKRYDPLVASIMDDHPVRAKREYQCPVCGGTVFKTQVHRRVVWRGVQDRVLHTDHVHRRCYDA